MHAGASETHQILIQWSIHGIDRGRGRIVSIAPQREAARVHGWTECLPTPFTVKGIVTFLNI